VLGRTDSARRLIVLLVVFGVAGSALLVRLGYWQIAQRDQLVSAANQQLALRTEVPSPRGQIFDRSGTVVLASTVVTERLIVSAAHLRTDADMAAMVSFLAEQLGLDPTAADALRVRLAAGKPYNVVAKGLTPQQVDGIRAAAAAAAISGISFESDSVRSYPQAGGSPSASLAAHLLGFVNQEGQGQYGIEQFYQSQLAGTPEVVEADKDANGQPIMDTQHVVDAGTAGQDLRLTVDAGLQLAVEQEVMAAKIADGARSASAVVMDPYTGEIYAEATYPSFDGNDYATTGTKDPGIFLDPVISSVYEPGSVFKMLTVLTALEQQTTTLTTKYRDTGSLSLDHGTAKIEDSDRRGMGTMRLEDAIAYSRNVVAAKVAMGLAPTVADASKLLHETWTRMGFGSPTGIDLSGEVGGLVNDPAIKPWRQIDLANGAFGQGVAVTPIQLAAAYAAMVNGGDLVQPHVVAAIGGRAVDVASRGSVLDPSLSPVLANLMHHVLSIPWYKPLTTVPGYWLGAKTGTAQMWDAKHHRWYRNTYNFSAVGFIGRTQGHPDLIVAVQIHQANPGRNAFGQLFLHVASTELFRRVSTDAITTPGLLPPAPAPTPTPSEAPTRVPTDTPTTPPATDPSADALPLYHQ
jgi:cell division protein FtsI/penicillin-binding protein 2